MTETVESLQKVVLQLRKEKEQEQRERNYYQLERDRVTAFWEITKKELEDALAEIRHKDRLLEEQEERHQIEMKVYKQKVRHLLYEHKVALDRVKTETEVSLKLQDADHKNGEGELRKEKRDLRLTLKEQERSHEEMIRRLKREQDKNTTKLRQEYERQARELQLRHERKMKELREELELRRRTEIHEIEERKNEHIKELMEKHKRAFTEIKTYYNDITTNNLDLIRSLKEELEAMKKKEAKNEKLMFEIAQENKRLSEPLTKALGEVEKLRADLANYQKDKMSLRNAKSRLKVLESQIKSVTWEHEVLQQRFSKVETERDELYEKFERALQDVQQRTGFRNLLLEKKLDALSGTLEKKEAQLSEMMKAASIDPSVFGSVSMKLEEILDGKNRMIKELQYELTKVMKAHNDVIRVYEAKLKEFGIPVEELGFEPLVAKAGKGPAGLVAN
eukprot:TRINITY_DN82795_c0_g1_i1.p1 TRINITY_DN82795_c0_g1~~TRINITY_DN82795_c0_g1_i1.p1  ORF type:complete len:449 (-),score=145.03 TRINITY_DN82795_c0_g1_i1:201-1547(-)